MNDRPREAETPREAKLTRRERRRSRREADEDDIERAIGALSLDPVARQYLSLRVLPYARFCENQANSSRLIYYWLRIPAIILAAIVPALVAANLGAGTRWLATGLGIVVAATAATEHFLNAGARWRHYRSTVESIKSETWRYLERESAADPFVQRIEDMVKQDWNAYIGIIDTEQTHHPQPQATEVGATPEGAPPAQAEPVDASDQRGKAG